MDLSWFFSPLALVAYAIAYGITMKVADLLDEHGLKWFKGSDVLFGLFWGLFGTLLVLGDNTLANIVLAMNIAFIVRNRLDYFNHQLAVSMIIIAFLFAARFDPITFGAFYIIFAIFGSLRDYVGDVLKKTKGLLVQLNDTMRYYPIPTFFYCLIYGQWIIFGVFTAYTISYDLVKYIAKKKGYR